MREPLCCARVARRLVRHGMPSSRIQRVTQELAEHWEDLRTAALDDGLSGAEAEAQADARLGPPDELAARIIGGFRRGSWFGRHEIVALCVVPLLLPMVLMALVAFPLILLDQWIHFTHWGAIGNQPNPYLVTGTLWLLHYAAMVASVGWLVFHGWRSGLGRKWILALCLWCALTALFRYFDADPVKRNVVVSFGFPWRLNAHTAIVLLVHGVAAAGFLFGAKNAKKNCNIETSELV